MEKNSGHTIAGRMGSLRKDQGRYEAVSLERWSKVPLPNRVLANIHKVPDGTFPGTSTPAIRN